jgi:hypothetical protein
MCDVRNGLLRSFTQAGLTRAWLHGMLVFEMKLLFAAPLIGFPSDPIALRAALGACIFS